MLCYRRWGGARVGTWSGTNGRCWTLVRRGYRSFERYYGEITDRNKPRCHCRAGFIRGPEAEPLGIQDSSATVGEGSCN